MKESLKSSAATVATTLGCTIGLYYLGIAVTKLLSAIHVMTPPPDNMNIILKAVDMWFLGVITIPAAFLVLATAVVLALSPIMIIGCIIVGCDPGEKQVDPVDLSRVSTGCLGVDLGVDDQKRDRDHTR